MSTIAIIPARYGSTRFPGKPLAELGGKPLIAHVVERAREARRVDDVIVATDDERIARAVEAHGAARAAMTSPDCATGTDRIAEVVADMPEAELIVNIQGDEPLMPPEVIDRAVEALEADAECAVATAMIRIETQEDFLSPHVVKVVCDLAGRAIFFSRSPLPNLTRATNDDLAAAVGTAQQTRDREAQSAIRNPQSAITFWGFKHFGLYVYRREALLRFVALGPSPLERIEKLEQLRFLENGFRIHVIETDLDSIGVDTPEDLEQARALIQERTG